MMTSSKKAFTLLELFICLTILSLIGSFFAVKGKALLDVYLFKQDVATVSDALQLAKEYAYCYGCDVEIDFVHNKQGCFIHIKSDEPLLHQEHIFKKPFFIKNIHAMYLQANESRSYHLLISGSGWVFPSKELILCGKNSQRAFRKI